MSTIILTSFPAYSEIFLYLLSKAGGPWPQRGPYILPSIASGNQVCNPNCADLPVAPTNRRVPINVN